MIEKYKKGKHSYTRWDKHSKQVSTKTSKQKEAPKQALQVEVPAGMAEGKRVNVFGLHSKKDEFVVDFGCAKGTGPGGGVGGVKIVSRVIMSPRQAKKLMLQLEKAIEKGEQ